MPITLDDLDSPVLNDAQASFVDGQFSNSVPLQIGEQACKLIEDCEISVTGQAASRRGTAYLGGDVDAAGGPIRALAFYNTPTLSYPVAIANTHLRYLNGSVWQDLGGGKARVSTTGFVSIVEGNDYLYVSDGSGLISRWDGTNWHDLDGTQPGHTGSDPAPTNVNFLAWHSNRLVASGVAASPDAIYFSGILDDSTWANLTGGYQIQVGAGDGVPITAIVSWSNTNLAVFKHNSVWIVGADPLLNVSDMPVQQVHGRIGCVASRSAVQVGSDIMFLSSDGIRSLNATIATDNRYDLGSPLSFPIQDVIDRINPATVQNAAAIYWKNKYIIAVPLDGSTTNNYIIVYNTLTQKWSGGWTNLPVNCFAVRTDTGVEKLMMGLTNDKKVIEYLDFVQESSATDSTYTDYNGNIVAPHIITRGMIFSDLHSRKKGINANIVLNKNKGKLQITAIFDEGAFTAVSQVDTGDPAVLALPFSLPATLPVPGLQPCSLDLMQYLEFYQLQFDIIGIDPGRKEIRQITAAAFPEATDFAGTFVATLVPSV